MSATIEVINASLNPVFSNAVDFDLAFCTQTSNQTIHLGIAQSNANAASQIQITSSNVILNADVTLSNHKMAFDGLKLGRRSAAAQEQIVTAIDNVPSCVTSSPSNVRFSLSNGQSNFVFLDSAGTTLASLSGAGNMTVFNKVVSSSCGTGIPSNSNLISITNGNWNNTVSVPFTVGAGTKIIKISASAFTSTVSAAIFTHTLSNATFSSSSNLSFYFNIGGEHNYVAQNYVYTNIMLPSGTYTLKMSTSGVVDVNDSCHVTLWELPC